MLKINREACALAIYPAFADIVDAELEKKLVNLGLSAGAGAGAGEDSSLKVESAFASGAVINFRDPDYSFESGGFHPVEVYVDGSGVLQYVTDFSFVGKPPFVELAKELDFSFELNLFGHMGVDYPLSEGDELFAIFQQNFVSYYQMEVFKVEVSE